MKQTLFAAVAALVLGAGSALAADLPRKAPVTKAPPPVVYNWTGFYIGAHVGGVWGDKDWTFFESAGFPIDPPVGTSHDVSGWLGGAQVGFNYQVGQVVFGVEGQFSWTDANGESVCPNPAARCQTKLESIFTVAGRLGYAWGPTLLYAKGGGAWVREEHFGVFSGGPGLDEASGSYTRSGWIVGAGLEHGFTPNWSAKVEYNFISLNDEDVAFHRVLTGTHTVTARIEQNLHIVKFGIYYRFGSPVVARY